MYEEHFMQEGLNLGLTLVALGMGTVFVFLTVLIFCTSLMSKFVMAFEAKTKKPEQPIPVTGQSIIPDAVLTAVISAAIHQHRAAKSKKA